MKPIRTTRRIQRGNPFLTERVHDPYRTGEKLREAVACPECGAHYRNGRWVWSTQGSAGLKRGLCPACRRIDDHYPAGELVLSGGFLAEHRDEILATARHVGEAECSQHPLNRIMSVVESHDEPTISITTTDVHLPHRIAHAIKDAWGGTMKTHYDLDGYFTRVRWERDG
jgi:NMD protein affecting ribosome stability and mRNA decay